MLKKLLEEIRVSGTLQAPILAARLNTSVPMVETMLEGLKRMGRLQAIDTSCADACGGCPMANSCLPGERARLWMLLGPKNVD